MSLTREDMLRELELLPVWQLRAPKQPQVISQAIAEKVAEKTLEIQPESKPEIAPEIEPQFEVKISPNKHWAFAREISGPTGRVDIDLQSMLLDNIVKALQIDKTIALQNLAEIDAKVVLAFGENVAQKLLNAPHKLADLQGKLHNLQQKSGDAKLIASNDLAHLIANPQDKAKLWRDICLARNHLQSQD